ncbi:MAG TPA: hypothetical protein VF635_08140 [Propionibacteriaceae bacterium]
MAKQLGVGKGSVRRWVIQSQVDGGQRAGASSEELAEIKALKAENRRLRRPAAERLYGRRKMTAYRRRPGRVHPVRAGGFMISVRRQQIYLGLNLDRVRTEAFGQPSSDGQSERPAG